MLIMNDSQNTIISNKGLSTIELFHETQNNKLIVLTTTANFELMYKTNLKMIEDKELLIDALKRFELK